jgi:hypothetical protein
VNREPDVTRCGQIAELLASLVFPREPGSEGQFQSSMTVRDEGVEKGRVVPLVRGEIGDPE